MVRLVVSNNSNIQFDSLNGILPLIARGLIIMGIVMFIRQAPKLIGDLFGIDSGNMKLGLMDKLAQGGVLTAGAAVGGLATTGVRNLTSGINATKKNIKAAENSKDRAKALAGGILRTSTSMIAGAGSGFLRSGYGARSAKNIGDMRKATSEGIKAAEAARDKRVAYKAAHPDGVIPGHITDTIHNIGRWAGLNNLQVLLDDNKNIEKMQSEKKALEQAAVDLIVGESHKNQSGKSFGITKSFSKASSYTDVDNNVVNFTGPMDTAQMRKLEQQAEIAKSKGLSSAAHLSDLYESYKKEFMEAVQNQALLDKSSYNGMISTTQGETHDSILADLASVRIAADKYRAGVMQSLSSSYVKDAGYTAELLSEDKSIDVTVAGGPAKVLKDKLNIAKANNAQEISKIQQKEEQSGTKKS